MGPLWARSWGRIIQHLLHSLIYYSGAGAWRPRLSQCFPRHAIPDRAQSSRPFFERVYRRRLPSVCARRERSRLGEKRPASGPLNGAVSKLQTKVGQTPVVGQTFLSVRIREWGHSCTPSGFASARPGQECPGARDARQTRMSVPPDSGPHANFVIRNSDFTCFSH